MTNCGSSSGVPYPENSTTDRTLESKVLKNAINYSKCKKNFTTSMNKHNNIKYVSDSSDFTRYKRLMSNKIMKK